ncbi:MAG: hypothetical protein [Microvirus sp.]|nr:MAG: hypothetical protein [Microvirus sp.]
MNKPITFDATELAYLSDALELKLQSIKRARNSTVPGSALSAAHHEAFQAVSQLIMKIGG